MLNTCRYINLVGRLLAAVSVLASCTVVRLREGEQSVLSPSSPVTMPSPTIKLKTPTSLLLSVTTTPAMEAKTATPTMRDIAMYEAVSTAVWASGDTQTILQPGILEQPVVYIEPTFAQTNEYIPPDIIQVFARDAAAHGLVRVEAEQQGGVIVSIGDIASDPANTRLVYGQDGPTIAVGIAISGKGCTGRGLSFLLTQEQGGWQAKQYLVGVC